MEERTPQNESLNLESWAEIGAEEQKLIEAVKSGDENAMETYLDAKQAELDLITDGHAGKAARELFDIRKALIHGSVGDVLEAGDMLYEIGRMAQETNNTTLEDKVNAALDQLGLE